MKKEWYFLGAYYALLLVVPMGNLRYIWLVVLDVLASLAFLYLYRVVKDEILFYVYNFIALVGIVFALGNYNPYSPLTLGVAYTLMALWMLHMTYARFEPMFGKVRLDTIAYTLLTFPLAYFSVYLFLIYPIGYGFWGVFTLVMLIVILIYVLMRSPKSEKRSHTP